MRLRHLAGRRRRSEPTTTDPRRLAGPPRTSGALPPAAATRMAAGSRPELGAAWIRLAGPALDLRDNP
jgi:hypothetical protein